MSAVESSKRIVRIPKTILLLLSFVFCICLAYIVTTFQRQSDYSNFVNRINDLLDGKNEMFASNSEITMGQLSKIHINPPDAFSKDSTISGAHKIIMVKPQPLEIWNEPQSQKYPEIRNYSMNEYEKKLAKWNSLLQLIDFYDSKVGGFTVLKVKRKEIGYDLEEYTSSDMAYRIPEYFGTEGLLTSFRTPTNRIGVQQAYNNAMNYLCPNSENPNQKAIYDALREFNNLRSSLHYLENVTPKYGGYATWESISPAAYFHPQYMLWYDISGKHYEIVENRKTFFKYWLIYSISGFILSSLFFLWFQYRNKVQFIVN